MQALDKQQIRVLVVDDHELFRAGVDALFDRDEALQVVAGCDALEDACRLAASERPDVILLDLDFGLEALPGLLEAAPAAAVLVLVAARHQPLQQAAMLGGARGIISKEQPAEMLFKAVKCVHAGELWADRLAIGRLLDGMRAAASESPAPEVRLTQRERDIIRLICEGLDNGRIAAQLNLSPKTVRNHLSAVFDKLGVRDRLGLAIYAFRHGLVCMPQRDA